MSYCHTQRAPLYLLSLAGALLLAVLLSFMPLPPAERIAPGIVIVLFVFCAFCFMRLTVHDAGDHLALRFGPIPLFRKRIPYAAMTAVSQGRSKILDGWGVHYAIGRGWTWNLWGFDCAEIKLGNKTIRVGSDDAPALVRFLQGRIQTPQS